MNQFLAIGLIIFIALLGKQVYSHKSNHTKNMSQYSVIFIDSILTGIIMLGTALYYGEFNKFKSDITNLNWETIIIFLIPGIYIRFRGFFNQLLNTHKLSHLSIVDYAFGLFTTAILSGFLIGQPISHNKIIAIPLLLLGTYFMSR